LLGETSQNLTGAFHLESNIPIGVGLGASAALCVAVARFFAVNHMLLDVSLFARELEHLFHGRSSGLDIAGVAASSGIYFQTGESLPMQQRWQPIFRLSSSEQIGITADCIQQVEAIWQRDPARARAIDTRMAESVLLARQALESDYTKQSEATLARAINQAGDCFYQWGLVTDGLQAHMQALTEKGALAVKPTGSGGGGYVVSLWPG
jgi:mevalonate kinase